MNFWLGIAIYEAGVIVALVSYHIWRQRHSDRREIELTNRIQAGTLREYTEHVTATQGEPAVDLGARTAPAAQSVDGMTFAEYALLDAQVESDISSRMMV